MGLSALLDNPLPSTESTPVKRKLAVIDAETDPFKKGRFPKPFVWGFYDGCVYEEFSTQCELLSYMNEYPEPLRVYAHNGGKFDYHFLLDYMEADTAIMIINGRLSKFNIGNVEFRDSYNLFNFPLSVYKKDEIDYGIMECCERVKPCNKRKISEYLQKDCIYLYELISDFIEKYGLHLTQAGAAMKIWSKMSGIKAPESTPEYYDSVKEYYYGGRVECFKKGIIDTPFKMVDIKSAYPFAMIERHPFSLEYTVYTGSDISRLLNGLDNGLIDSSLSPAMFNISARSLGALPYRDKKINKLTFPNDNLTRNYSVTGWEIQAGLETGTLEIKKIHIIKIWDELIDFSDYVSRFFALKEEAQKSGDKLGELFAKLFLNALYGKWAADPRKYKSHTITYPENIQKYIDEGGELGGFLGQWALAVTPLVEERHRFYNVATAASITGFVRAYLWRALCACGGLVYCDTDSIAAHDISLIELSDELGGWGIDGEFLHGGVGGRKMYAFSDGKKWKCASKGARLTPDEIIEVCKGGEIEFIPESPTYSIHKAPRFINRKIVKT